MIRELYCKLPTDLDYETKVESTDDAFNLLQLIKVILGTKPGEVLGNPMFGMDLEKYLFSMNYDKDEIIQAVNIELALNLWFDKNKWTVDVDVLFGRHNDNDTYEYAVVDIIINQNKCLGILVNQSQ